MSISGMTGCDLVVWWRMTNDVTMPWVDVVGLAVVCSGKRAGGIGGANGYSE